jgi:hypothetical protein
MFENHNVAIIIVPGTENCLFIRAREDYLPIPCGIDWSAGSILKLDAVMRVAGPVSG